MRILTDDEAMELRVDECFKPFDSVQVLHCNSYTQPAWRAAMSAYERRLRPSEKLVAGHLRDVVCIYSDSDQPVARLRQFEKYANLVARKGVAQELVAERERFSLRS